MLNVAQIIINAIQSVLVGLHNVEVLYSMLEAIG